MSYRSLAGALALTAAVLALSIDGARAFDESKFPDWKGQWIQLGGGPGIVSFMAATKSAYVFPESSRASAEWWSSLPVLVTEKDAIEAGIDAGADTL